VSKEYKKELKCGEVRAPAARAQLPLALLLTTDDRSATDDSKLTARSFHG